MTYWPRKREYIHVIIGVDGEIMADGAELCHHKSVYLSAAPNIKDFSSNFNIALPGVTLADK